MAVCGLIEHFHCTFDIANVHLLPLNKKRFELCQAAVKVRNIISYHSTGHQNHITNKIQVPSRVEQI